LSDETQTLQNFINDAYKESRRQPNHATGALHRLEIELKKGDHPVQEIIVPSGASLLLYSKDKVRLIFMGKRNRPLFLLEEKSELVLREKLEIYYNTNNVQEAMKLMIRAPPSSTVHISNGVKISLFSYKSGS